TPGRRRLGGRGLVAAAVASSAVAFAYYAAIGLLRYDSGRAGNYDLGIFAQAAQRWSEGRLPGSAIRGLDNLFADHFSPITAVLGAAWAAWADPRSLILTQALAIAVAVGLLAEAAFRRLPVLVAAPLVVGAILAKGAVSAAFFDVHETGLGTPLMAGLCLGLLERRRRLTVACALALLLVKEDLGLTVVVAGLVWWRLTGDRRTGLLVAAAGVAGVIVAFGVVLWANPEHTTVYLQFLSGASGNPQGLAVLGLEGAHRWEPALVFVATAGVIGLRSPIALLAVPTLAWRALSSNHAYWETYFHYDVLLVPIAAFALLDVLSRPFATKEPGSAGRSVEVAVRVAGLVVMIAAGLEVARVSHRPLLDPAAYRLAPRLQAVETLGRDVPPGEAVAAQQNLGPVLVSRLDVRMLSPLPAGPVRWVVLTKTGSLFGAAEHANQTWLAEQQARPGVVVTERDDVVLVRLPEPEIVRLPAP
ncbi:MAG: DUF2079 domain-containing protein, partial [Kineosporiaceae bacterium]